MLPNITQHFRTYREYPIVFALPLNCSRIVCLHFIDHINPYS